MAVILKPTFQLCHPFQQFPFTTLCLSTTPFSALSPKRARAPTETYCPFVNVTLSQVREAEGSRERKSKRRRVHVERCHSLLCPFRQREATKKHRNREGERRRQRELMVSDILGDSSRICLPAAWEVILRKRDSYARQKRRERRRDKNSTAGGTRNSETVRRQKTRSKSVWESLWVWWILIGQCLQRHANEKVRVLWVNGESVCEGVALLHFRMINTTKALNHKTLISH